MVVGVVVVLTKAPLEDFCGEWTPWMLVAAVLTPEVSCEPATEAVQRLSMNALLPEYEFNVPWSEPGMMMVLLQSESQSLSMLILVALKVKPDGTLPTQELVPACEDSC